MKHSIMLEKNPNDTWILLKQLVPGKSKQNKCNFQNPSTFNKFFFNSMGENVQRRETETSDQWIRCAG